MTRELVATLDSLAPGKSIKVVIDDLPIAVVRESTGEVHAIGDRCSHGDISLSDGFVEDDTIECWAHGAKFSLETGEALTLPAYEPVAKYEVIIDNGDIFIETDLV